MRLDKKFNHEGAEGEKGKKLGRLALFFFSFFPPYSPQTRGLTPPLRFLFIHVFSPIKVLIHSQ
jgi:hypothetical protein